MKVRKRQKKRFFMFINGQKLVLGRYSSGELKLLHEVMLKNVQDNEVIEILYNKDIVTFFELLLIIKYYKKQNKKINLTLTYLPYQRMDHNNGYEVETLKLVADLLNELNLNKLTICEPHCPITYFNNANSVSFVDLIFKKLQKNNITKENSILFFTDNGARRRYEHLGNHFITGEKVREKETGLISSYNLVGKIEKHKQIVLIDDIISTGDTMICALDELLKHTNQEVIIVCGHFEKNKYNKRLLTLKNVKHIYASSSLTKRGNKKLTLFKVRELLYGK
ncbi:MAG: hypothetical protein CVV59_01920 [Tenericutes bacterium HGW-Tenericutes-4]|nr:MAG: hypothetical protein CVV59_01920 [Tenericutes bacterium HGW-Tenericutes-4]